MMEESNNTPTTNLNPCVVVATNNADVAATQPAVAIASKPASTPSVQGQIPTTPQDPASLVFIKALYDYKPQNKPTHLSFAKGDTLKVLVTLLIKGYWVILF